MGNLDIYNAGREVPAEAQKQFNNGKFSGTDINPMWRIKKLTELFGPAGVGWYVDNVVERAEEHNGVTMAIVTLELYIKVDGEWSKPIYGTGGNILVNAKGGTSDEGYKMAYTDALSIACKSLGIGADIWFAQDKTKYTAKVEPPPGAPEFKPEPDKFVCANCKQVIQPWIGKDGATRMSVREIAQNTEKEYGQRLCLSCIKKLYPDGAKS